jgi:KDO2-lipid IV(A) lauroyltransferase
LEAALLLIVVLVFKVIPTDMASSAGGLLARIIGPLFRAHRVADNNLRKVFPEYSEKQRSVILSGMWDNLGRVAGEYAHLSPEGMRRRMTIEGAEYLTQARESKTPAMFVAGHFANWEMCPLIGVMYGLPVTFIYREANNPYADKIIQWLRVGYKDRLFGKGRESAQQMIKALRQKGCVGMLIDQKFNEGSPIPLMGFNAMTTTSAAKLAIKFKAPFIPIRVVRTDGAHFHVTVGPPIPYNDQTTDIALMEELHKVFGQWIRDKPEQWFWVHNRWNWKKEKK